MIRKNIRYDNLLLSYSLCNFNTKYPQWSDLNSENTLKTQFKTNLKYKQSSLKSEWQQVSSTLRDSPQYYNRFQLYCGLDSLNSSSDLRFSYSTCLGFSVLFQGLQQWLVSVSPSYSTIHFWLSGKVQVFVEFFAFFYFGSVICWNHEIHRLTSSFLLVHYNLAWSSLIENFSHEF